MNNPKRTNAHILDTKAKKFLERHLPDEWFFAVPDNDYGIDYHVDIVINNQVTGLNFSIQLKAHEKCTKGDYAKAVLKKSTLNYYNVRLEPVMIVVFEEEQQEAYFAWNDDLNIDLSKDQKDYTVNIPKKNTLTNLNWSNITKYVQAVFNNRSFIDDFDISKIHSDFELAAWKSYYESEFDQAVYLFREVIKSGSKSLNVHQALAWSLYQCHRYPEALSIINLLERQFDDENIQQIKGCILAEFGMSDQDKGKILQAKDLFRNSINSNSHAIVHYNYANTLSALGDVEKSINQYEISLEKDSNFAPCWKNLGTAYGMMENHEKELKCYDNALSINPNLHQALFSKGIALAKDFKRYGEALECFNKVLEQKNNLTQEYVNGLFWVAECYEKLGNIQSALYWINHGLNFSGSNIYLLNFKSNLLANHWPQKPELKKEAESFFLYRLELSNDFRSLYHLIKLLDYNVKSAYPLLQKHTPLFKTVSLKSLEDIGFDLDMMLKTLLQMDLYGVFKDSHPVTRYLDHLISEHFSIGAEFWDLLDVVCAYAFNMGLITFGQLSLPVKLGESIIDTLIEFLPRLVPFLIECEDLVIGEIVNAIFDKILDGYPIVLYREIGAQTGFLTYQLNLPKIEFENHINEKSKKRFIDLTIATIDSLFRANN